MPPSPATREYTVTYGGFALGSANGCYLQAVDEKTSIRISYPEGSFRCRFVVVLASPTGVASTDNTSFSNLCTAVEAALRKPNQRLQVVLGNNRIDWNPASGSRSAFRIRAECRKTGGEQDSARTAEYEFEVRCLFPADLSGANNRVPESFTEAQTTISGRRIVTAQASWTASSSQTALQNYTTDGDTYFTGVLPTPVTNGEWVKVSEDPRYDDENTVLTVTRVYWEVVSGLREYEVSVERTPSQARRVTVSGIYTKTASNTAKTNHDNNVGTFVSNVMTAVGVTTYEAKPDPRIERYGTTEETYFFSRTHSEIVYAQGSSNDDPNVVRFELTVTQTTPTLPRTVVAGVTVQQLRECEAIYIAEIDKDSSGGTDLENLWRTKFRAHAVAAVQTKLGASGVAVVNERLSLSLDRNAIVAVLQLVVRGGDVVQFTVQERVRRTGSREPAPRADGKPHSYFLFQKPPEKILFRTAIIEFVAGSTPPVPFKPGEQASGHELVNTGSTIQEALDALEAGRDVSVPGWLALEGEWDTRPTTRGEDEGLSTVVLVQQETWLYVESLEQAPRTGAV